MEREFVYNLEEDDINGCMDCPFNEWLWDELVCHFKPNMMRVPHLADERGFINGIGHEYLHEKPSWCCIKNVKRVETVSYEGMKNEDSDI